jgi:hypothetical protein
LLSARSFDGVAASFSEDGEPVCRMGSKMETPETARWAASTFDNKYLEECHVRGSSVLREATFKGKLSSTHKE